MVSFEDITGGLKSGVNSVITAGESALNSITKQSATAAAVGAALGVGGALLATGGSKKKSTTSKKKKSKSGRARDRRFKSKQKHEQRYKRKRKYKVYGKKGWVNPKKKKKKSYSSRKGVHYTKNGQPYILLRSGKARFIKRRKR